MKWITREEVNVDRVACPWLIKKFIDPQAEFVFLPGDTDWQCCNFAEASTGRVVK
jgi:hypothetical protein